MSANVIFVGWDRSLAGREEIGAQHFQEVMQYLGGLQQAGAIDSFEAVLLNPHGGDLNGFILIRAEPAKLYAFESSEEWEMHMTRAGFHLIGLGAVRGVTGQLLMDRMQQWSTVASA